MHHHLKAFSKRQTEFMTDGMCVYVTCRFSFVYGLVVHVMPRLVLRIPTFRVFNFVKLLVLVCFGGELGDLR